MPKNYQGQDAIDYIGADLPKVAANYGLTPEKLKDLLLNDATVRIDSNRQLFYIDVDVRDQGGRQEATVESDSASGATASNASIPIATTAQLADAFKLHSNPGASKTIYLNFVGYTGSGTAWSSGTISSAPYDLNGNPSNYDDNERRNIISIWNRVAEDYSAFDVDVTTEPPTQAALIRSSVADAAYGTQVVIAKSDLFNCGCGGVAYVGVVSMVNNTYYQPAWVFQQSLANNEKYIAEAISHEAGHTLGLFHDGNTSSAYYTGHGTGVTSWAPIMGAGYYANVTQWSKGEYPNANNKQDDIAVMASNGIAAKTDDVGNTMTTASSLTNIGSGGTATVQTFGVIETSSDVDMFMFDSAGGTVNLTASPVATGPNLDAKLTLYNSAGAVIASSAPSTSLSAAINQALPAGTYFLAISNSGRAASGSDYGYSNYGSLGQYQITGSYETTSDTDALAPVAVLTASTTSGPAALTVNFSANNSVGNGNIVAYQWVFGDGSSSAESNPVHTYTTVGTYTAKLTVTNEYMLSGSQTVQIVVTAPPTKATLSAGSASIRVVKRRTSVSATMTIKVVDANGKAIPNAVVTGTWSGAFNGTVSSKTNKYGIVAQSATTKTTAKGGSGTYTLSNIALPGYTYDPTKNVKSVFTIVW
ncbi:PKD domain-containing protein [Methylomonas sp. MgM2]